MKDSKPTTRLICEIASDICSNWQNPYFGAVPYINAMQALLYVDDMYYADSAKSIIRYFLANAKTWRGETAKRIKAELNEMVK